MQPAPKEGVRTSLLETKGEMNNDNAERETSTADSAWGPSGTVGECATQLGLNIYFPDYFQAFKALMKEICCSREHIK